MANHTNVLLAFANLARDFSNDIKNIAARNRANSMGDGLEKYVQNLFCGISENDPEVCNEYFSYLGNASNPPDIMIKNGDAIEVKKMESRAADLALNSSYPKNKLFFNSPMITKKCREAENWREKDMLYVIGFVKNAKLKNLNFVYGDIYCAENKVYENMKGRVARGIAETPSVEFSATRELGRVNRVDPLGITYLRVRGMWGIENPARVFAQILPPDAFANLIISREKYFSFPEIDRENLEKLVGENLQITDAKVQSPDNPAQLVDVKVVSLWRK